MVTSFGGTDYPDFSPLRMQAADTAGTMYLWGPFFTVNDDTQVIDAYCGVEPRALNTNNMCYGGAGMMLWDLEANKFLDHTFVTGNGQWQSFNLQTMVMTGLQDRTVGIIAIDNSWNGWNSYEDIGAPDGSITLSDNIHHVVTKKWDFDAGPTDLDEWSGDVGSFTNGHRTATHYMRLDGVFTGAGTDNGWLDSRGPDSAATGTITSEVFTVDGDVIEFRIAGDEEDSTYFELVRASDDVVLHHTYPKDSGGGMWRFRAWFWPVRQYNGVDVYLRVVDNDTTAEGNIMLDAIRMVAFDVTASGGATPGTLIYGK